MKESFEDSFVMESIKRSVRNEKMDSICVDWNVIVSKQYGFGKGLIQ